MKKQASGRFCFVCGVENASGLGIVFYETGAGEVSAEVVVPDHFQGYPGIVHGGVIAAMLDEAAGRCFMQGDPPRWKVTAKLSIRYRKPVPTGEPLKLLATVKNDLGMIATATSSLYDQGGRLLAEAEVTLADMPQDLLENSPAGPEDWKVYPDEGGSS
ncbi:MAG: PaaI family thioesterase [Chloroflexi bacterium]|jgi:uncharacterized protein (TIGR00369 family)|nr:PaaI family thioesterase [Anaerolineaceae bacterium]NMB87108.1 PaaI family thioesterase [Chloroflexota bacterium]